jgi:hypothetical protein
MRMRLNRGGQPEAKAQVEGPQVKNICINGLKTPPLGLERLLLYLKVVVGEDSDKSLLWRLEELTLGSHLTAHPRVKG